MAAQAPKQGTSIAAEKPRGALRLAPEGDEAAFFAMPLDAGANVIACARPALRVAADFDFAAMAGKLDEWHRRGVFDEFDDFYKRHVLLREEQVRRCADHMNGAAQRAALECVRSLRAAWDEGYRPALILNYNGAGAYAHVNEEAESVVCGWHGGVAVPLDPGTDAALHDTRETDLVRLAGTRHASALPARHEHRYSPFTVSMQGHR